MTKMRRQKYLMKFRQVFDKLDGDIKGIIVSSSGNPVKLLSVSTNKRLDWKDLPGTKT